MLKNRYTYLLFYILIFSSCSNNSEYKGYTKTGSGLYYKLLQIGDGKHKPVVGDYLQLCITYKTDKDSVFMDTYSCNDMNEGDAVSFIVSSDSLFKKFFKTDLPLFLKQGSIVKMDVKLNRILNETEYNNVLNKYEQIVEDRDIEEQRKLKTFLDTNQTQFSPLNNGMYYLPIKQGVGDFAEDGDLVKINYKGYFLDGKQFESTYDTQQPLEFIFGEEGQVIGGFQTAISLMNEGAKTKFIIPSQLAFDKTGSSTGIVPPYTTVVYEIELINLTKHNN
jgi:FKBP-type peptidyl-prolyl cis-trans isomerase FkpA